MLKFRTVKIINLQDWDRLVEETYGRPYNFQQQNGCQPRGTYSFSVSDNDQPYDYENDTIPEVVNGDKMGVSFKAWLERDPKQPLPDREDSFGLGLWWDRNFYPSIEMVIEDLRKKGLIENGDYMIEIDW